MNRRFFLTGGLALIAAPAIVRATSLMPVRQVAPLVVYGESPAMTALGIVRAPVLEISHDGISWRAATVSDALQAYGSFGNVWFRGSAMAKNGGLGPFA